MGNYLKTFGAVLFLVLIVGAGTTVWAGTVYTFEAPTYTGTIGGTSLGSTDDWTSPSSTVDVYTYTSNSLGFVSNPLGQAQFAGLQTGASGTSSTASHAFSFVSSPTWLISYDFAILNNNSSGSETASKFSLYRDSTQVLASQTHYAAGGGGTSQLYSLEFQIFDSFGTTQPTVANVWTGLAQNNWYRQWINVDNNQITSIALQNLTNSLQVFTPQNPLNWYLGAGGAPNAVQILGGGSSNNSNSAGFDNLFFGQDVPEPSTLATIAGGLGLLAFYRRRTRKKSS